MDALTWPGAARPRASRAFRLAYVSRGRRSVLEIQRPAGRWARNHLLRRITRAGPGLGARPAAPRAPGRSRPAGRVRDSLGRTGRGVGDHRGPAPGPDVPAATR